MVKSNGQAWRAILLGHAADIWAGAPPGGADAAGLKVVEQALGPMAEEALQIVEAYALGAKSSAALGSQSETTRNAAPPEFASRLNIILNGLEPVDHGEDEEAAPQVIQSKLWQLLFKIRESAELSYAREADLVELDRRILFLLRTVGALVPADISSSVGVDKAQVSRSVKRLLELKMVERGQIRAPVNLTRKGQSLSDRLARLADLRNRELTFDIADGELTHFFGIIEKLLDRAVMLYERERDLGNDGDTSSLAEFPIGPVEERKSGENILLDRTRIISPLMTLSAYFGRSGSLTFKRLTGLSNFEAWVLNEVSMTPPIEWNDLVGKLDRDHSQAGRTVKGLMERGLILRAGKPGRRHGRFSPSETGQELYDVIQEASRQRSTFLLAPLSASDRELFLATFDKIRRNAVVQLEREKAFEEIEQAQP